MQKILVILLTLSALTAAPALPSVRLHGTVSEKESGLPLAGADVLVLGTKAGASTDAEGYFEIDAAAPGSYDIAVHCTGYRVQTQKNILLQAGEAAVLHFKLEKER